MKNESKFLQLTISQKVQLATIGMVLNIALGELIRRLEISIFFDSLGTVMGTLVLGPFWGVGIGVLSFLLWGLVLGNEPAAYFIGSQVAIALFVAFVASRGWLKEMWALFLSGLILGVVTLLAGAPILYFFFSGDTGGDGTGRGEDLQVVVNITGEKIYAILVTGALPEIFDKTIVLISATSFIAWFPRSFTRRCRKPPYLRLNGLG